jgi:transcriptional regulator with XRE-family HTH domain
VKCWRFSGGALGPVGLLDAVASAPGMKSIRSLRSRILIYYVIGMQASTKVARIFPDRLRAAREMRALSQLELAERARLQQAAVSHYEAGARRPGLRNLRRLSEALEVTTDYLVGRSDSHAPHPSTDEPLFQDFERLTIADRELARQLVGQLARRSGSEST